MDYKTLEKAVVAGDFDAFKALLEKAGNLSEVRNEVIGGGILHYFVNRNRQFDFDPLAVIDLLVVHGDPINEKDKDQLTPLMLAVLNFHPEIVEKLLACGADTEQTNSRGVTPLFTAMMGYRGKENQLAVIQTLIDHGAELDTRNKKGVSILELVESQGEIIDEGHSPKSWDLREFLKQYR